MKNFTFGIAFLIIFAAIAGAAYVSTNSSPSEEPNADMKAYVQAECGDFPESDGNGGPTSRYFVCAGSDSCYYKQMRQELIDGCDPEFDTYDYGKDECFETVYERFDIDGEMLEDSLIDEYCTPTTQRYFESQVN